MIETTKGGEAHATAQARAGEVAVTEADRLRARLSTFRRRVDRALSQIEEAARYGRIGVSFSGGKDSTVLLDLVRRVAPDAPAALFDSGAELADTLALADHYGVRRIAPVMSLIDMCKHGGYWGYKTPTDPNATFDFGEILIDEPARRFATDYGLTIHAIGLRADESRGRWWSARTHGELYQYKAGLWRLCPLLDWTVDDIWAYIASHDLAYNTAYDKLTALGVPRLQQRISTTLGTDAASFGRYVYLKRLDPDLWNRLAADFPKIRNYT